MILTKDLLYIHTHKTGGCFVKEILESQFKGKNLGYNFNVPRSYYEGDCKVHVGSVRNPFDWYVSMYHYYKPRNSPLIDPQSDFQTNLKTLLNLYGTKKHKELQTTDIEDKPIGYYYSPKRLLTDHPNGGFYKKDFINYPNNVGFYTWLWKRMNTDKNGNLDNLEIIRTENLNKELVNVLEKHSSITDTQKKEILNLEKTNTSKRGDYRQYYTPELVDLVYKQDRYIFDRFNYEF